MKYVLGLDLGITSVGWAVLNWDDERIEALGVRAFTAAEQPKNKESLAAPRRLARSQRRRLRRHALRLTEIRRLFEAHGLVTQKQWDEAFAQPAELTSPWDLRARALDMPLTGLELARSLYHIAAHRGFKSNRLHAASDKDADDSKMLAAAGELRALMQQHGYRTPGEMIAKDERFEERKRNRAGDYSHTLLRDDLLDEVRQICASQRRFGNALASPAFEEAFIRIAFRQRPVSDPGELLHKVGACTFEPAEKRAPKKCFSNELSMALQKLNNISWTIGPDETPTGALEGDKCRMTPEQLQMVVDKLISSEKLDYAQLRKLLKLPYTSTFTTLRYYMPAKELDADKKLTAEEFYELIEKKQIVAKMPGVTTLRKKAEGIRKGLWTELMSQPELLDRIGWVLTYGKDEATLNRLMDEQGIVDPELRQLVESVEPFAGHGNLSLKALRRIIPFLQQGLRYSDACERAGYNHARPQTATRRNKLPVEPLLEEIRNPVVLRALTQARKVVNAVIDRYGAPTRIHIELARELGKTAEQRSEIESEQRKNQQHWEAVKKQLQELYNVDDPKRHEQLIFSLYREQNGRCAYSQLPIELERLREPGYLEVDHILPYSRTWDNSQHNKVLVLCGQNRNKRNQTPYEWLGHDTERWQRFVDWVNATIRNPRKRANLLRTNLDEKAEQELVDRNLIDTQYIARFFANYVRANLQFADPAEKVPVQCYKGRITAWVRREWGLEKHRAESDLHHAQDAAVLAALTPGMQQKITRFEQKRERMVRRPQDNRWIDPETGEVLSMPDRNPRMDLPWRHFRKELVARLSDDPQTEIDALQLPQYRDFPVRPIIVSRMPRRKVRGALHEETVRSVKHPGWVTVRTPLTALRCTEQNAEEQLRFVDPPLRQAIIERLRAHDWKAEKAFVTPLIKPHREGAKGHVVRAVRVARKDTGGLSIRKGQVDNASIVRCDVFYANGRYEVVPVYTHHVASGVLPNRACVQAKPEAEWIAVNDNDFKFSLYPCDLFMWKRVNDDHYQLGYYSGYHRRIAGLVYMDIGSSSASDTQWLSYRTTVENMQRCEISVLGEINIVKEEPRRVLAQRCHR